MEQPHSQFTDEPVNRHKMFKLLMIRAGTFLTSLSFRYGEDSSKSRYT